MRKFITNIVAAAFVAFSTPVFAQEVICNPQYPTIQVVEEKLYAEKDLNIVVYEGQEAQTFRQIVATSNGIEISSVLEFDKHIFASREGNDIGLAVMIKGDCIVKMAPIPVSAFEKFKDLIRGI